MSYGLVYNKMVFQKVEGSNSFKGTLMFNYAEKYVNLPVYVISTIVPIFSYTYVIRGVARIRVWRGDDSFLSLRAIQFFQVFFEIF